MQSIIERCQAGEKDAFEELLKSVEKKAIATAYFICGNTEIAKDILQETYLRCFVNIKALEKVEYFNTWFFKILVRTSWEIQKKSSKVIPMEITSENEKLLYNIDYNRKNEIDDFDIQYMLQSAIDKLTPNLKTVIVLYYYNYMTTEEIAKITGSLKATVRSRLFYARHALKKQLSGCNDSAISIPNNEEAYAHER